MTERKEWNILYGMPLFCIFILFSWYGHYICLILHWLWCIESTVFVTKDRKFYLSLAYWKVSFIWRVVVILRNYYMSIFSNWIKFPNLTLSIYSPLSLTTQQQYFWVLLPLPVLRHSPFLDICSKWKWMNGQCHVSFSGHGSMHSNLAQCSSVLISQSHSWCI